MMFNRSRLAIDTHVCNLQNSLRLFHLRLCDIWYLLSAQFLSHYNACNQGTISWKCACKLYKANCISFSFLNPLWCNGPISIWCRQTSFMTYFLLLSNRASLTWKILLERHTHWLHTELNKNNKKLYILGWLVDLAICIHSKAFWRINEDPILESLKQPHPLLYSCYFNICCYLSACVLAIPSEAYQCRYTYAHMYIYADNNRF